MTKDAKFLAYITSRMQTPMEKQAVGEGVVGNVIRTGFRRLAPRLGMEALEEGAVSNAAKNIVEKAVPSAAEKIVETAAPAAAEKIVETAAPAVAEKAIANPGVFSSTFNVGKQLGKQTLRDVTGLNLYGGLLRLIGNTKPGAKGIRGAIGLAGRNIRAGKRVGKWDYESSVKQLGNAIGSQGLAKFLSGSTRLGVNSALLAPIIGQLVPSTQQYIPNALTQGPIGTVLSHAYTLHPFNLAAQGIASGADWAVNTIGSQRALGAKQVADRIRQEMPLLGNTIADRIDAETQKEMLRYGLDPTRIYGESTIKANSGNDITPAEPQQSGGTDLLQWIRGFVDPTDPAYSNLQAMSNILGNIRPETLNRSRAQSVPVNGLRPATPSTYNYSYMG